LFKNFQSFWENYQKTLGGKIFLAHPVYTVSGKKSPRYFRYIFDKLKHIFIIFGVSVLNIHLIKLLRYFLFILPCHYVELT